MALLEVVGKSWNWVFGEDTAIREAKDLKFIDLMNAPGIMLTALILMITWCMRHNLHVKTEETQVK